MLAAPIRHPIAHQEVGPPPLVLDLAILLSPFGPWLIQRLAQTGEIWLPRAFLAVIESASSDEEPFPATLAPTIGDPSAEGLRQVCRAWRERWAGFSQMPDLCWLGDSLDVSHPRKGLPAALLDRFDELVQGLDASAGFASESAPEPLLDAARDTLALAAALSGERAVILSAALRGSAEPSIVAALDRFGIAAHRLEPGRHRDRLQARVLDRLEQAQVLGLLAAGTLRLGLVHLCVPQASRPLPPPRALPSLTDDLDEDELAWPIGAEDHRELWEGAMAVWHDVE
jgi:hypothetical protein